MLITLNFELIYFNNFMINLLQKNPLIEILFNRLNPIQQNYFITES